MQALTDAQKHGCEHAARTLEVAPEPGDACQECAEEGTGWVSLRVCMTCGHTGCCDSSPMKHAREHYHATKHPVTQPLGDDAWAWCFEHADYV